RTGSSARAAALELLHAERNALLLDVDIENLRLHGLTFAVELQRLFARHAPGDVGHVDHAVDVAFKADKQAEFGRILDLALEDAAHLMILCERNPRILLRLLQALRTPALP